MKYSKPCSSRRPRLLLATATATAASLIFLAGSNLGLAADGPRWWKGNLHTHSLWSDGDDYPEMIVEWYREHGYHFLALSDHNIVLEGQKWIDATNNAGGVRGLERYVNRFGPDWVEQRRVADKTQVRLKPLGEFRHLFEEPGRFLLMAGEEITDRHLTAPVHINATNLRDFIPAQGGSNVLEVMQNNVRAVLAQRERTGQPMIPHLNHPNFVWGITAEELMRVQGERFFEVYNGHPEVRNQGDAHHASTERMWDIVLTWRLAVLGMEPMFGLATDDSHNYHVQAVGKSNTGRGWVMVRAPFLTPEHLIRALEAGDFYASSGIVLKDLKRAGDTLAIEVEPETGVSYTTQFIGTRRGFDQTNEPRRNAAGEAMRVTHRYSDEVGEVLAEVRGTSASYALKGDELYVRAKIISTKTKANPYVEGEVEVAWTQPLIPAKHPVKP